MSPPPSVSCSTARAPTPPSKARRRSCRRAISSSPPTGRRTITATPPDQPMLWLDVLDVPAVNFFETSFAEDFDQPTQETTRQDGNSLSFYASGVLPDGTRGDEPHAGHQLHLCPHAPDRGAHDAAGEIDKSHGARVRYANPINGGPVLPTMGANLAMLPKGFEASRTARPTARFSSAPKARPDRRRRRGAGMGSERRVRRAVVEALFPHRRRTVGAVLDFRPAGAGSARHLARGE